MITDLMAVHTAFLARFEGYQIRDAVVPVKFFNAQPKLKEAPAYPCFIATVFIPKFGNFTWVADTEIPNTVDHTVTSIPAPKDLRLKYQVDARANRFDDINALFLKLNSAIEVKKGSGFLTVSDDTFDCSITDTREVPDFDMGVFQWSFTYDVRLPLFGLTSEVKAMIQQGMIVTVRDVSTNEPLT